MTEQFPDLPAYLTAGTYVAGYRVEGRIGQGGMAAVYRAYDQRLDRLVALKVLAPSLATDEAFRLRFIRESRAAAAVDDPHIIPVFAAGESDGVLFIAMRLVRGGDVRSLIDRIGPLPPGRAAEIISQTASALDAAHTIGLVHRDVKPANMLLEASLSTDRPDHVYLSDFGLTKASLAVSGLTATGQFLGTLDYIAPEQIEGRPIDGRTDQYGLACAAFELLCGEPPFRRQDSVSVMYAQLNEPPPLLRLRRPDLPDAIDEVMARALAKTPADRYGTCREFAAALRLVLGLGVPGRDSGPPAHPVTELASPASPGPDPAVPGAAASKAEPPRLVGAGHTEAADYPPAQAPPERPPEQVAAALRPPPERPPAPPPTGPLSRPAAGWPEPAPGLTTPVSHVGADATPEPGRRPWWRSPLPVAGVCAVVLLAGGGAYALASHGHNGAGQGSLRSLSLPSCTIKTARAPTLNTVTSATVSTGGSPFGIAVTADGQYSFVSVGNAVDVFRDSSALAPTLVRTIPASHASKSDTLTPNGHFLLAAASSGAVIINVAEAVQGAPNPVVGTLTSPNGSGAFQALVSADDSFAFVTLQGSAEMAVFNLKAALTQGVSGSDFIGYVPLGNQPVGMASDGTWIYVTNLGGTISIVNERTAETNPPAAGMETAQGGCGSARAMLSADGSVLWVTARQSDELLGFSTARLRADPLHALIARVMVGEVPLGETFARGGSRIVVADSNLNSLKGAVANLAVIDTARALAGQPALLGYIPTGELPRAVVAEPGGGTLLVSDERAGLLQALRVADLP